MSVNQNFILKKIFSFSLEFTSVTEERNCFGSSNKFPGSGKIRIGQERKFRLGNSSEAAVGCAAHFGEGAAKVRFALRVTLH